MSKYLALLALVAIIGGIIYMSWSLNNNPVSTFAGDAREIAEFYGKNKLTFILPPEPPQPEKVIVQQEVQKQVQLENGTIVNQTTIEEVEMTAVSGGLIKGSDKQTGIHDIVRRGHQYLIEAKVELYDSVGIYVEPPYRFDLTISCEFREWCDNSSTVSTNPGAMTDGSGGFSYVWATKSTHSLGDYHVTLNVRSAQKINNIGIVCTDSTPECRFQNFENTLILKLVK